MSYNPNSTGNSVKIGGSTSGTLSMIASAITTNYTIKWPSAQGTGAVLNDGSGNLSWSAVANATLSNLSGFTTNGIIFASSGSALSSSSHLTFNGSQAIFNVVDSYGGFKIMGRSGGEASFSLQPDTVADGEAGQWIFYTNGSQLNNANDFAMYNSQLGSPSLIIQAATGNVGIGNSNPSAKLAVGSNFTVDNSGNANATGMVLNGSTSGFVKLVAFGSTTSYIVTMPSAQGTGALLNDGSGNLSWGTISAGANTSLSNLFNTQINADLIPSTDDSENLGSASFRWANVYAAQLTSPAATASVPGLAAPGPASLSFLINSGGNFNGQFYVYLPYASNLTPFMTSSGALQISSTADGTLGAGTFAFTDNDPTYGMNFRYNNPVNKNDFWAAILSHIPSVIPGAVAVQTSSNGDAFMFDTQTPITSVGTNQAISTAITIDGNSKMYGNLAPATTASVTLGTTSLFWQNVYSAASYVGAVGSPYGASLFGNAFQFGAAELDFYDVGNFTNNIAWAVAYNPAAKNTAMAASFYDNGACVQVMEAFANGGKVHWVINGAGTDLFIIDPVASQVSTGPGTTFLTGGPIQGAAGSAVNIWGTTIDSGQNFNTTGAVNFLNPDSISGDFVSGYTFVPAFYGANFTFTAQPSNGDTIATASPFSQGTHSVTFGTTVAIGASLVDTMTNFVNYYNSQGGGSEWAAAVTGPNTLSLRCGSYFAGTTGSQVVLTYSSSSYSADVTSGNDLTYHAGVYGTKIAGVGGVIINGPLTVTNDQEYSAGNSGTALNLNFSNGPNEFVTLTGNCTLTFSNMTNGQTYLVRLVQDGTGSRTVTWPSNVKWPNGAAPVLSTAAGAEDLIALYYNGTNFYGSFGLNYG